jgi:ribulose-phosphate 3-epimerase
MTVNPGFGGQKLITQSLEKVKHLRKIIDDHGYEIDLQVDGGINPLNAKSVVSSGANILVAGNSIFKNTDYKQAIDSLRLCAMQS